MSIHVSVREHLALGKYFLKWLLLATPLGLVTGTACALFLWLLNEATRYRALNPWLLFLLPVAGFVIAWVYSTLGKASEAGNNLIVDEIHEPGGGVPLRMAPLVLFATIVTHLFGGSAGREGTAVQMGGSLASGLARLFPGLQRQDVQTLLKAGIAAGFGGVFGTPIAGTIFALEVLAVGRMSYAALIPCLVASIVSDQACSAWGIGHVHYQVAGMLPAGSPQHIAPLDLRLLALVSVAGLIFGLTSTFFSELTHGLQWLFKRMIPWPVLRPVLGACCVIGLVYLLGTRDYLGLGVSSDSPDAVTVLSAFHRGGATPWSWFWKILFTAITLSSGFKGGEVTPLFFIGATLGNVLAGVMGAPVDLFAALGFVSVFAGATNTPIACTIMAIELFGGEYTPYFATSCLLAYLFSGHSGIYLSQRIGIPKPVSSDVPPDVVLRQARAAKSAVHEWIVNALRKVSESAVASPGVTCMSRSHKVVSREIGQVQIYIARGDARPGKGLRALFPKPLYLELIDLAKTGGLLNATAHPTQYGFTNGAATQSNGGDIQNPQLNMCVELIDHRDKLEAFCSQHAELLRNRVLVYKHLEHWELHDNHVATTDATPDEDTAPDELE